MTLETIRMNVQRAELIRIDVLDNGTALSVYVPISLTIGDLKEYIKTYFGIKQPIIKKINL